MRNPAESFEIHRNSLFFLKNMPA